MVVVVVFHTRSNRETSMRVDGRKLSVEEITPGAHVTASKNKWRRDNEKGRNRSRDKVCVCVRVRVCVRRTK